MKFNQSLSGNLLLIREIVFTNNENKIDIILHIGVDN